MPRDIGDGCFWEGISLINACWVSQCYQVLNAVSDACGKIIFHFKKEAEKIVTASERLDTNYCQVQDWKDIFARFSIIHKTSFCFEKYDILCTKYCVAILSEGKIWKFMVPWRKISWHILQIAKVHFRDSIWFAVSEKNLIPTTVQGASFFTLVVRACTKKSQQTRHTKKLCIRISNSFSL